MSYHVYSIDGYGVETDWRYDEDKLIAFIKKHPTLQTEAETLIEGCDVDTVISEYEGRNFCVGGIASMLSDVIEDETGEFFTACEDFGGNKYLLFEPKYPWFHSKSQSKIKTEDDVKRILTPYLKEIFNDSDIPKFDYYSCENGG